MDPALSNGQIVDVLKQNADDLGPAGYDSTYAYGRVNAFRAVSAVSLSIPSTEPEVSPTVEPPPTGSLVSSNSPAETVVPSVRYVMTGPLIVQTNGLGTVAPNLGGRQLEVGRNYRVRAVPGPGQVFAGWSGGLASDSATLNFTMQTNLTLVANFVTNPFPAVRGTYSGLVANTGSVTPDNSGYFALAVTRSGFFSGNLRSAGQRNGFSGRFNLGGDATVRVRRGLAAPLALALHVDLTNVSDSVSGSLSDGTWVSPLAAGRNVFNAWSNPAQQAGLRSFILERAQDSATAAAGLSRISASGATSVRGKLNDGRVFSTGSALAKNGDCPFYLSLNRGTEMVIGWLNFAAGQGPTASGTVLWVKTGTNAFATTLQATPGQ